MYNKHLDVLDVFSIWMVIRSFSPANEWLSNRHDVKYREFHEVWLILTRHVNFNRQSCPILVEWFPNLWFRMKLSSVCLTVPLPTWCFCQCTFANHKINWIIEQSQIQDNQTRLKNSPSYMKKQNKWYCICCLIAV